MTPASARIRPARADDLPALQDIERAAGEAFRAVGMAAIADDELPTIEVLSSFQRDGRALVATDDSDRAVAYVLVEHVDGRAHVEQLSVHPEHARRRLGAALLDRVEAWAVERGLRGLTLTTFAQVPWNAPYYVRLGFEVVPDQQLSEGLRHIRDEEAARGLNRWPRVTMRRDAPRPLEPVPARDPLDVELVGRLVAAQFPQWAHLPIRPVPHQGWDNRTFRLGGELTARLPSASAYALAVEKEQRWLPVLAQRLPLPIPVPLAEGRPGPGYPHPWSVYRWLDGEAATQRNVADLTTFAVSLADFLAALRQIDPAGGPVPGQHNWFRGGPLRTYDDQTRRALDALDGRVDTALAAQIWECALGAAWDGRVVWFHGDVAQGNLLVKDGALAAVIDFGTCGVGDPACDLTIAWTLLSDAGREAFRDRLCVDAATWARGRGWALWKALVTYAGAIDSDQAEAARARNVIDQIFVEFASST